MNAATSQSFTLRKGLQLREGKRRTIEESRLLHLRDHLFQAGKTRFYNELFQKLGCVPDDFHTLSDLQNLPLTDRSELGQRGEDFIADGIDIIDITHTSGTTGTPIVVPYTGHDLQRLAYNEAIAFYGAGLRPDDKILLTVTLDKGFVAGLAYYCGTTMLGASAIRCGPGQMARQWHLIETLKPTVLLGVPSFLLGLARWGEANGHDPVTSSIRTIITIGEPIQNGDLLQTTLGSLLKTHWQAQLFSSYGSTEMEGSFLDCPNHCGGHVHPELMIAEIVDENGRPLPPGQPGEVVATPLGVQGLPLIRFKTGDIARLHTDPCSCGWNTERLGPIEGRVAQRLKFKGTTLYPDMIFQALQKIPGTEDSYIEAHQDYALADDVRLIIGIDENSIDIQRIQETLSAVLRVTPHIELRNRHEVIEKTGKNVQRKIKRFFDYRDNNEKQPVVTG